jgi:hypothetical protein
MLYETLLKFIKKTHPKKEREKKKQERNQAFDNLKLNVL